MSDIADFHYDGEPCAAPGCSELYKHPVDTAYCPHHSEIARRAGEGALGKCSICEAKSVTNRDVLLACKETETDDGYEWRAAARRLPGWVSHESVERHLRKHTNHRVPQGRSP
jgi:hypothetical protein